jgi:hypothetical protein
VNISDCDAYMFKCNCCVLLSESIHVFMHLQCWLYYHPLVAGWAPTPLWCRFAGRRSLVAVSLWGWLWSLLVYLSILGVFIESMFWSVTLGIEDLFYFRLGFRIILNSVLRLKQMMWKLLWCFEKIYSPATIFNLNEVSLNWRRCVEPLHV